MSAIVHRTLKIIEALVGHEAHGIDVPDICTAIEDNDLNTRRALKELQAAGWVEPHPVNQKKWRITVMLSQFCNTVQANLAAAERQLQQDRHNYNTFK